MSLDQKIVVRPRPREVGVQVSARLRSLFDGLAGRRWVAVPVLAAVMGAPGAVGAPPDSVLFSHLGRAIVHGHLGVAYANSSDQSGPFQLLVAAILPTGLFGSRLGAPLAVAVLAILLAVAAMWGVRAVRHLSSLAASPVHELAGGLVAATFVASGEVFAGHLAEVAVPVMWVAAAIAASRGWASAAGALLGLSAGWEPWGVLGAGIVLLLPGPRAAIKALAVAILGGAACYLPFVLTGHFALPHHRWPVQSSSLVHLLWPGATTFGWLPRLIQGGLSIGVGAVLAARMRRSPSAIWVVPMAVVLVRLIFDPTQLDYYWVSAQILVIVAIGLIEVGRRGSLALVIALCWLTSFAHGSGKTAVTLVALCCTLAFAAGAPGYQPRVAKR